MVPTDDTPASGQPRRDYILPIAEALLLSIVTITAAWSGFAAAKWSTESSLSYAEASTARTKANRADVAGLELRNFDSSTFEAWFAAYIVDDKNAMALAERRFRPEFKVAFDAWRAANPESNPNAPRGPTYTPEYKQPELAAAQALDQEADELLSAGAHAGATSDKYVRTTVFLAGVLFLVGMSSHFPLRNVRYGLLGFAAVIFVIAVVQLTLLPSPL